MFLGSDSVVARKDTYSRYMQNILRKQRKTGMNRKQCKLYGECEKLMETSEK